jgi:phosphoribosylanthranilate isomerase
MVMLVINDLLRCVAPPKLSCTGGGGGRVDFALLTKARSSTTSLAAGGLGNKFVTDVLWWANRHVCCFQVVEKSEEDAGVRSRLVIRKVEPEIKSEVVVF